MRRERPVGRGGWRTAALLTAAVSASAAAGCKVGPNYVPPAGDGQTPEAFKSRDSSVVVAAGVTAGPVKPDWWNTLGDAKLVELVDRSVAENLDLKTADARVREQRAARGLAASALGPSIGVGSAGAPGAFGPGWSGDYTASQQTWRAFGFDASWEIDVFGGNRRSVEAATAGLQSAVEARRDVLVSLLGEVGRTYVELRGAQRRLDIARRNIEIAGKVVEFARIRRETGLAGELEVRQATTQLETVKAGIPRIEAAVSKAAFRLGVLQAKAPGALLDDLSKPGPLPATPPEVPTGLPSDLLRRRPDIRRAERELAAATAQVGVAVSDRFPKFALTANVTLAGFYAGPSVRWPIFDSGKILSNIAVQDARLEQATLRFRSVVLTALEDVENSLNAYAQEQVRRISLAGAATEAERAAALAEQQYKDGLKDFLVVLDAHRTLYATYDELVQSEQAALVHLIALYKALGGGWEAFDDKGNPLPPPAKPADLPALPAVPAARVNAAPVP